MNGAIRQQIARRAPGPSGTILWGSLTEFQRNSTDFLMRCARNYGDISRVRFGPITAHLLNHPDHVRHVMVSNADNYDKNTRSAAMIRETCGDSLLSGDEDAWLRHRRLIQPVFHPRFLESIDDVVDASLEEMFIRWEQEISAQRPIDINREMMRFMIGTSARILFSSNVDVSAIDNALTALLADTWRRLQAPFDPSFFSPRFHKQAFKRAVVDIDAIVFKIIAKRRNEQFVGDDLLSLLLNAHEQSGETGFSDKELRDAAVTLLLAGHETTASVLASTFWLVGQEPERELETVDPSKLFQEAIRLYPSIWILERRAVESDVIGGMQIPKGSSVLISPYVLHRSEAFWPEPDRFDPSRFDEGQIEERPRHAYIPFGLGKHRCVGIHMANRIADRVLGKVFQHFEMHLVPGQKNEMQAGITLRHATPILFKLANK